MAGLFKWGGRDSDEAPAAATLRHRRLSGVTPSKVLPRFLAALAPARAGAARSRSGRRSEHLVLRRAALLQDLRRGSLRRSRSACPSGRAGSLHRGASTSVSATSPARSTASSAGTCSIFSIEPTSQALAARLVRLLKPGGVAVRILRRLASRNSTTTPASSSRRRPPSSGPDRPRRPVAQDCARDARHQ